MWHPDQIYAAEQARRAELVMRSVELQRARRYVNGVSVGAVVRRLSAWARTQVRLVTEVRP